MRADYFETLLLIADLDWKANQRKSAMEWYGKALSQIHMLVQMNPQDHELTRRGGHVYEFVGQRFLESGDEAAAADAFNRGAGLAGRVEGNMNILDGRAPESDQSLSARLLRQAAEAYDAADMPDRAISVRQQLDQLSPNE